MPGAEIDLSRNNSLVNFLHLCAPHSLSFRNAVSCRPAPTSRTTRRPKARLLPESRCCRSYASLHVFFHCPVQACVKTAQTLGWKARDGSDPFVGMRLSQYCMQAAASASAAGRQEARPEQRVGLIPWRSTESL